MAALVRRRTRHPLEWPLWFSETLPDWGFRWPELADVETALDREGMRIEEFRDGDELVVKAEMPGIDPDKDVEITVSDNVLCVSAERKEEKKEEDTDGYRTEFRYGRFTRAVRLPAGATEDDVKASYSDGILEVRVPIAPAKAEARKIPIART